MSDASVRLLEPQELPAAARIVARQMFAPVTDDTATGWAEGWAGTAVHGAFDAEQLVGMARWFPTELSMPGVPVPAAAVTGVAVLSTHRRRGHLSRLMVDQLRHAADAGNPVAVLIAAEYPIYGRFGYGPATVGCTIDVDTAAVRFRDEPSGSLTLVEPAGLRDALQAMHRAHGARVAGLILRPDDFWDRFSGLRSFPGHPAEPGKILGALWHDEAGALAGAVMYRQKERWTGNRPDGKVTVDLLVGASAEAERELWRHVCGIDWAGRVKAEARPVDDPLPLWLHDARAAAVGDQSDAMWARVLDVPRALGARRRSVPGTAVLDVVDPLGYAHGRWQVEVAADGASVEPTTRAADVRLSASALGAALLGGHTVARLARAGLVDEERPGGVAAATALLAADLAPWAPLDF